MGGAKAFGLFGRLAFALHKRKHLFGLVADDGHHLLDACALGGVHNPVDQRLSKDLVRHLGLF